MAKEIPSTAPPLGDSRVELTDKKLALEVEKLQAETAKAKADTAKAAIETEILERPWYRKSASFAALQPVATIVIAATGVLVGYSNGWFQTKLESLRNAEDRAAIEIQKLGDLRSAIQTEIATLKIDNANLKTQNSEFSQKLATTLAKASKYKDSLGKEDDSRALRQELEKTIAETKAAQIAAEAAKWHEGDGISISVVDALTRRPRPSCLIKKDADQYPSEMVNQLTRLNVRPGNREDILARWGFGPHQCDDSGRITYKIRKDDLVGSDIRFVVTNAGYQTQIILIPWGTKSYTVFLIPGGPQVGGTANPPSSDAR